MKVVEGITLVRPVLVLSNCCVYSCSYAEGGWSWGGGNSNGDRRFRACMNSFGRFKDFAGERINRHRNLAHYYRKLPKTKAKIHPSTQLSSSPG